MSGNGRTYEEHIHEQRAEDARFLMENGCSMEQAARRLKVSLATLEKSLSRDRRRREQPHPDRQA